MSYYEELLIDWQKAADGYDSIADAMVDIDPVIAEKTKGMSVAIRWCKEQLQEVIALETDG